MGIDDDDDTGDEDKNKGKSVTTLASFLKAKNATSNQIAKFLATAAWLDERAGQTGTHTTGDITKALSDNHQSKLKNASTCLSRNVTKGFCEKKGRRFYVTDEGRKSLK